MPRAESAAVAALLSEPWAISEDGRRRLVAGIQYALSAEDGKPLGSSYSATNRDGVAIIPIYGPLSKRSCWLSLIFGASDYESALRDFRAALSDNEIKSILFCVDSPGGEVSGCDELASAIFAARGKKPIVAYVDGTCASAAYWIASSANRIVASPTAIIGSIGVYQTMVDDSDLLAKIGITEYDIVAKQSPYKVPDPSNADDRDRARATVSAMADVFIASVARGRGVGTDVVESRFGRGDVMVGQAAVTAGMVDALGDFESTLASMSTEDKPANAPPAASAAVPTKAKTKPSSSKNRTLRAMRALTNRRASMAQEPEIDHAAVQQHVAAMQKSVADEPASDEEAKGMYSKLGAHMKALHAELGDQSPFKSDAADGDGPDGEGDDGDDKEEKQAARAVVSRLEAISGKRGAKAAIGTLESLAETRTRLQAVEKELAQAKADKRAAELKAMLDTAVADGRLTAANRGKVEALAAKYGNECAEAQLAMLSPATVAAEPPKDDTAVKFEDKVTSPPPLPADQIKMLAALGMTPEEFAEHRKTYQAVINPSEEE